MVKMVQGGGLDKNWNHRMETSYNMALIKTGVFLEIDGREFFGIFQV